MSSKGSFVVLGYCSVFIVTNAVPLLFITPFNSNSHVIFSNGESSLHFLKNDNVSDIYNMKVMQRKQKDLVLKNLLMKTECDEESFGAFKGRNKRYSCCNYHLTNDH